MANRDKGEYDLTIAGQSYRFKMGTAATIELQEHFSDSDAVARLHYETEARRLRAALSQYGAHQPACKGKPCTCGLAMALLPTAAAAIAPLEGILQHVFGGRIKYLAAYFWSGLKRFHPEFTLDAAMDLLDQASPDEVRQLLVDLGLTMQPSPEDAKELKGGAGTKRNPRKAQAVAGRGESSTSRRARSV